MFDVTHVLITIALPSPPL